MPSYPYFPVGYQPVYPQNYPQQAAQNMTPPTIHAEIVQVESEQAAASYPVGAGASQMMIARDESAIYVKTASANGQYVLTVFDKRPPAPPEPVFDPGDYVRRDEIETLIAACIAGKRAKKENAE